MSASLDAGRELDALIAQSVMDWPAKPTKTGKQGDAWPSLQRAQWLHCGDDRGWEIPNELLPHYSTDVAAAWRVVEKLMQSLWSVTVYHNSLIPDFCGGPAITVQLNRYGRYDGHGMSQSKAVRGESNYCSVYDSGDLPLAICRAALKAVAP